KEYPVEQYLRDSKIASIYEGANGIQSMDLMGRKMRVSDGAPYKAFMAEIEGFLRANTDNTVIGEEIRDLGVVVKRLGDMAAKMGDMMSSDPLQWASYTYPALLCFGDVAICWRLLDMAIAAQKAMDRAGKNDFYRGKIMQATYYAGVTLPLAMARLETCLRKGREVVDMPDEAF
ncbi:MAG: acyl-CoA dehydrogenase, partial [Deltaproteobacteria bacterium]|nr:acyl-CoA dehydrogenase [Deltaproteobacteria bacterium]